MTESRVLDAGTWDGRRVSVVGDDACDPTSAVPSGLQCAKAVFWWEEGLTTRCVLQRGHDGLHRDGVHWFDNDGLRALVAACTRPPTPAYRPGLGGRGGLDPPS